MTDRKRCPTCRQFMPAPLPYGARLTPQQKRIADIVRRAGPEGISVDDIIDTIYAQDPDGGPTNARRIVWVQIYLINKRITPKGFRIRNTAKGGGPRGQCGPYCLTRVAAQC